MFDLVISVSLAVALFALAAWLWRASLPRLATIHAILLGFAMLVASGGVAVAWYLVAPKVPSGDGSASMADRLPEPTERAALLPATQDRLWWFEAEIDSFNDQHTRRARLARLHDREVQDFVEREGFGVGRSRVVVPSRHDVPVRIQASEWPSTDKVTAVEQPAPKALSHAHRTTVAHFLHVPGFGIVRDRTRVWGFEPHGFREPSQRLPFGPMTVERVELVSLLIHPEPVVYMTATLPTMEGVREFPTRPLDEFEAASLKLLRAGEDITSAAGPEVTRAFGSIRSTKHCVSCHGGERGDLLGAFSYTLRADAEKKP
jgi:hypothetical protein